MKKKVFILVGPKGSGKSFLASHLEKATGLKFLRVEDIWMKLKCETFPADKFESEGCTRVVQAVGDLLKTYDKVVIESIGASTIFHSQVAAIKQFADVILIRIRAPAQLCLKRVRDRDPTIHLNVSDERVVELNRIASNFELNWDLEFENTKIGGEEIFASLFRKKFLVT